MYRLRLAREVSRYVEDPRALPPEDARRIVAAIREFAHDPRPRGSIRLKDTICRSRVVSHRIVYHVNDKQGIVTAGRVARRREDIHHNIESIFR